LVLVLVLVVKLTIKMHVIFQVIDVFQQREVLPFAA